MSHNDTFKILVLGNTFAASMTVLALSKVLPEHFRLVWIKPLESSSDDMLYGGLSSPEAYQFNLQHGVTEPELVLNTSTTFSFGTYFSHWGEHQRAWMQCFHLPFAAASGVELHHFMTRHDADLGDFLISAQAAIKGTFAHPPIDNLQSPLSRAEYGYHFEPSEWAKVFFNTLNQANIEVINLDCISVKSSHNQVEYLTLSDGSQHSADLFVDCSGTPGQLINSGTKDFVFQREVLLCSETQPASQTGPACRHVTGNHHGWQSVTPLRNKNNILCLYELSSDTNEFAEKKSCQRITLGHRDKAWQANCLAIGHAAYALEPLTPAPYILLKKDIERLLELIPVNRDFHMERQEYNRRYQSDVENAELFHRALYAGQRDVAFGSSKKLERKLNQYAYRGILTSFDFEPFNKQDWAILHAGLGRKPERYDRMAEQVDFKQMQSQLHAMREGIARLAASMPAHHVYLEKLSAYLRENQQRG